MQYSQFIPKNLYNIVPINFNIEVTMKVLYQHTYNTTHITAFVVQHHMTDNHKNAIYNNYYNIVCTVQNSWMLLTSILADLGQ